SVSARDTASPARELTSTMLQVVGAPVKPTEKSMMHPRARILRAVACGASVTLGLTAPCVAAPKAAYIPPAHIDAAAHQLSQTYTDDEPLRVIDAGAYRVGVFVVGRPRNKDAQPLSDDGAIPVSEGLALPSVTAILRILKGSGVFVTGGKLDDPVP